ncbi:cell division protein FtsQ/DivIB [Paludisphaera soli]|uniref:cell division protein FtsQ/DivIB n=1 Tax=Paludisphaera soli TaxID=2712865 RepID=UPI0013EA7215|nr:hypothetical protein [Paludisphaera soli]
MEYRDLSRIVASDADDGVDPPARVRRFEFVRSTGRLDLRKLAAALLLSASLLGVLFYAGGQALNSGVAWLHRQPQYQLPFDRIELPIPPPACFRGGTSTFLDRVRRNAEESEVLPILDVDPERIRAAFKRFPWVEQVLSVEFPPRGLVVRLAYREPVAKVQLPGADQLLLDREGCILPVDDIDVEQVKRLIWIRGDGLTAPAKDRVGKLWRTEASETSRGAVVDRGVIQAAHLAGFLLEPARREQAESSSALRIVTIYATDPPANRGLFIRNADGTTILWGRGPGDEQPGEQTAPEKWEILVDQAGRNLLKPGQLGDFWEFGRNEMRFKRVASGS